MDERRLGAFLRGYNVQELLNTSFYRYAARCVVNIVAEAIIGVLPRFAYGDVNVITLAGTFRMGLS